MTTAARLEKRTSKELAEMAKKKGVQGWHSMRKAELVESLLRLNRSKAASRSKSKKKVSSKKASTPRAKASSQRAAKTSRKKSAATKGAASTKKPQASKTKKTAKTAQSKKATPAKKSAKDQSTASKRATKTAKKVAKTSPKSPSAKNSPSAKKSPSKTKVAKSASSRPRDDQAIDKMKKVTAQRERLKNLATANGFSKPPNGAARNGSGRTNHKEITKDRIALLVRDPYWMQASWEITRQSVQRAQAALAEQWVDTRPILRLMAVDDVTASGPSTGERVVRDIEIHGGVSNWYIDVQDPPATFRVDIGYLTGEGRFHVLARSNTVSTPAPGSSEAVDANWSDVASNYERIYALSGGYTGEGNSDLQDMFEERLHRPMGSPLSTRFGIGAERMLQRDRDFDLQVDAELVVYGITKPNAYMTVNGEPIKVQPDGSFAVTMNLPDRRQVIPVVAGSADGVEQRTVVLAVERNTKVMEPVIRDPNE